MKGEIIVSSGLVFEVIDPENKEVQFVGSPQGIEGVRPEVLVPSTVEHGASGNVLSVVQMAAHESYRFYGIASLTLPNTCRRIGFLYPISGLKKLVISSSVSTIANEGLAELVDLEAYEVDPNSQHFKVVDGVLYSKDGSVLRSIPSKKAIGNNGAFSVPTTVSQLYGSAFRGNTTLASLHIPASVRQILIDGFTFEGCTNLKKVTVDANNPNYSAVNNVIYNKNKTTLVCYPSSLEEKSYKVLDSCREIASYAIYKAPLTSLDLNRVETLNFVSLYAPQLKSLTIPSGLTTIPEGAIRNLASLESYAVATGNTAFVAQDGVLFTADRRTLISYPLGKKDGVYAIPAGTEVVAKHAFYGAREMTAITVPSSLLEIREAAFLGADKLAVVEYAGTSKLRVIGSDAFRSCSQLEAFKLPSSVETVGSGAFIGCKKLKRVTVETGSQLRSLGYRCFVDTYLQEFVFEGSAPYFTSIGTNTFSHLFYLRDFRFPSSLQTIADGAFLGCVSLQSLIFPENSVIKRIGGGAFADCIGLREVLLPKSLERIDAEAFRGCGVLTSVTLTDKIGHVDPRAFLGCRNLREIKFPDGAPQFNKRYSTYRGVLYSVNKDTLAIYPAGLTESTGLLRVPPVVKVIGEYACFQNRDLRHVIIPKSVQKIEDRAFSRCDSLKKVTLLSETMLDPNNIKHGSINENAFDEWQRRAFFSWQIADDGKIRYTTLYVPANLVEQYKVERYYQKFVDVLPFTAFTETKPGGKDGNITLHYQCYDDIHATLTKVVAPASAKSIVIDADAYHTETSTGTGTAISSSRVYRVNEIGDGAFAGTKVEEVIVRSNPTLERLGTRAFVTSTNAADYNTTIQRVIFLGDAPPTKLNHLEYDLRGNQRPFAPTQKIHVKQSKVNAFKTAANWEEFRQQVSYTIEGRSITNRYVTFSREFDFDFNLGTTSDLAGNPAVNQTIEVYAGAGVEQKGFGDYGTRTTYKISFTALKGDGKSVSVAKNTGILIKNTGATAAKFYYRIHENQNKVATVANNVLNDAVSSQQYVTKAANQPAYRYYVLQGGVFRLVPSTTPRFLMNPHTAYLLLKTSRPAGAPEVLGILEDGEITGIEGVEVDSSSTSDGTTTSGRSYDLRGVRTNAPVRGVVIKNGKKVLLAQ